MDAAHLNSVELQNVALKLHPLQEMLQDMPAKKNSKKLARHPLDEKYSTLQAKLDVIPKGDPTFKVIETYFKNTTCSWRKVQLENVWSVDGQKDGAEFTKHSAKIGNRKLLWHGTNVAVVAAIMKGGLRIMPHSGVALNYVVNTATTATTFFLLMMTLLFVA